MPLRLLSTNHESPGLAVGSVKNAMADLTLALTNDALTAVPGVGSERYQNLYELLPLYPIVSVLSAQGHVGPCQQE